MDELNKLNRESIRFVVISVLPENISNEIIEMSSQLSELFGSKTALLYPPHITIRTGAIVPIGKIESFVDSFKLYVNKFVSQCSEDDIVNTSKLDFIEYIENGIKKYLVAYLVNESPWLVQLHNTLDEFCDYKKSSSKEFHPHISLAYNDLDLDNFIKIKKYTFLHQERYFRQFSFKLSSVSLFYQKDDGFWKEFYKFNLDQDGQD